MSNPATQHPEDGLLLRYIDGELPARKRNQIQRHLEACWQCRSEVEELQGTVADCVRYRKTVLQAHLPEPPQQWADIYREFDRIDESLEGASWPVRFLRSLGTPARRGWALAAAALLLAATGIFYQLRETPSVQAATLLQRAISVAKGQPVLARRLRVRTRTHEFTREVGSLRQSTLSDASASTIQALFQTAHYDWNDPLSARAFQVWRDSLVSKTDEVASVPDPESTSGNCYRIRTTTADGPLDSASLTLRATDLHPVAGKLEFRDREWVEFTELTEATTRDDGRPVATNVEPPVRRAEPSRSVATPSGPTASISDELQVVAALHEIGADLGDPIEVNRSPERVVVSGIGIPPQRQKQIHGLLDGMPHVEVQFSDAVTGAHAAEPPVADSVPRANPAAGFEARVEQQVGGRAEFERFSSQVLDRNEAMMSRAYALRALAQRFSVEQESALGAEDRQVLRGMVRQHVNALAREAAGLERALNPVLSELGGSAASPNTAASTAWQPAVERLFVTSHRVEVLVSSMLGVATGTVSGDRLPSDLLTALHQLRIDLRNLGTGTTFPDFPPKL